MKQIRPAVPLDAQALDRLALRYVERYATTRVRLARYLQRKLRERGWDGEGAPPVDAVVARMAALRYVDDEAFVEMRTASLLRRGYGARRVKDTLRAAGVEIAGGNVIDEDDARAAALAFARRRRFGPFAATPMDPDRHRRAFAAMLRAGHPPRLVREILDMPRGENASE